ncbi:MAG: 3-hydroxyacyl-CoA dehydrogenase NAD-binding domain-containing protein [Pirellulales bacterium]|nr:3-hydroxyacyl-CoA dehydrogenase NAD-binding domain-containing protein [Pirellulales bacterium]
MGAGIAQVAAQANLDVLVSDLGKEQLERGRQAVSQSLKRLVKKDKLTADAATETGKRIRWSDKLADHHERNFVIEAVSEDLDLKSSIFAQLDQICDSDAILASNTSSISISHLGSTTNRPENVIGMHFMNPVPVMSLVEIVCGTETHESTYETTRRLAEKMGKSTTRSEDAPGFIANRVLMPMINEAFFLLDEGVGTAEDIDTTMQLGMSHPMGPLALADLIGLDTCQAIMNVMHRDLGDAKFRPCPLLCEYVKDGRLGRKTGSGVYSYED